MAVFYEFDDDNDATSLLISWCCRPRQHPNTRMMIRLRRYQMKQNQMKQDRMKRDEMKQGEMKQNGVKQDEKTQDEMTRLSLL